MKHILSFSLDPALATTRQLLLESRGYAVTTVITAEAALAACRAVRFDLLIVGQSARPADRAKVIRTFREKSGAPVVSVSNDGGPTGDETAFGARSLDPTELLYMVRSLLILHEQLGSLLDEAIALTGADFGTVQLADPAARALTIAQHRGFGREFLEFFQLVHGASCCGEAMQRRSRVIIENVARSPVYDENARGVMLRAQAAACQSTPLMDGSGRLVGMVSTHYRSAPQEPEAASLHKLDHAAADAMKRIAEQVDLLRVWGAARGATPSYF